MPVTASTSAMWRKWADCSIATSRVGATSAVLVVPETSTTSSTIPSRLLACVATSGRAAASTKPATASHTHSRATRRRQRAPRHTTRNATSRRKGLYLPTAGLSPALDRTHQQGHGGRRRRIALFSDPSSVPLAAAFLAGSLPSRFSLLEGGRPGPHQRLAGAGGGTPRRRSGQSDRTAPATPPPRARRPTLHRARRQR